MIHVLYFHRFCSLNYFKTMQCQLLLLNVLLLDWKLVFIVLCQLLTILTVSYCIAIILATFSSAFLYVLVSFSFASFLHLVLLPFRKTFVKV